jgi:hypothetical protein
MSRVAVFTFKFRETTRIQRISTANHPILSFEISRLQRVLFVRVVWFVVDFFGDSLESMMSRETGNDKKNKR